MPSIDESIRKIDNVICRHLDEIENNSRGAISQDILEQLTKFVNHIMLKFYANGREIPITAENIAKATEFAQINSELYTLYKFHNYLEVVTTQYTLDEDGSERLMLKYYQYLLEAKNLIWHYFGIEVLHNLEKFPLHLDDTLQEYYKKISEKIELDTCKVIERLQELAEAGIENYSADVEFWLLFDDYEIDCDEKKDIITRIFSESKVGVIYGSAGVGKSTLINHVSHYLKDEAKLYLTQTNPAKENLMRKIDAENTTFSTIESFKRQGFSTEYKLLVIDECSTVSNKDMVEVLQKAKFEMLLLVGDTYQIDAIQFGNWFSVLKSFLPESAVFELTQPHRTKDERLLELWDKVRQMDDTAKEVIERESYSLKVDETLLSSLDPGEAILCLNYDGLYGINNINRFLQESNPNPAVQWDIQQYKVGDPILFLDSDRFFPIIHNNMKGIIKGIEILNPDTHEERIQFDVEIPKVVDESDLWRINLELLECWESEEKSLVRFCVHKLKSADEDGDESISLTVVPFQIAYAVSIHKAQGLEYDSVKIVITDEVEELVTHNIFYTAITRARERLKIYWTPEVEEKVINRIRPRDISKDVELLKNYLTEKQQEESFDFWL